MRLKNEKTIGVDFDDTIVRLGSWNGKKHVGRLKEEDKPKKMIRLLKDTGFNIMIYTCRSYHKPVKKLLERENIPYDWINENPNQPKTASPKKLFAWRYIDDRGACYVDFPTAVVNILKDAYEEDNLIFENPLEKLIVELILKSID